VPLDKTAAVGNGISAEVVSLRAVRGAGRGPGNVVGPALRATIQITNRTKEPVGLDGVEVDLAYGADHEPASPVDDPAARPFSGMIRPGESARGVYVFALPAHSRDALELSVGYQAGAPLLVFAGSAG
jgi:hypothetical protein